MTDAARAWRRTGNRHRSDPMLPLAGVVWWALAFSVVVGGPIGWTLFCALATGIVSLILLVRLCLR